MSAVNPYAPPRAAVADVDNYDDGVQPVRTWSSQGRVGRLRYLAHLTGAYLLVMAAAFALGMVMGAARVPKAASAVGAVLGIAYLVFAILKTIQRSHDMDWTGWSVLLTVIPLVGLIWIFKPGTDGGNRFGPPAPANTLGVKVLGLLMPVLAILGIVIAIAVAVPAYNQYAQKAKAARMK